MKKNKLIILITIIASVAVMSNCRFDSDKSRISNTMCEYVKSNLTEDETFDFVGLSNRRDTIFMESTHPCAGVIYTIANNESGDKTRHFADVIFSEDYKTVLSVNELDFDPIDFVKEKVKETIKEKILER